MITSLVADYIPLARPPPSFFPITENNRERFKQVVAQSVRHDPFSRSAAYYSMTGRNGLWVYGDGDTALIIARHPNKDDTLLFIPPIGPNPTEIIAQALDDTRLPSGNIELARVGSDDLAFANRTLTQGSQSPTSEKTLDWTYPIHVVSPSKVIAREGKSFVSFRGHINRAIRSGFQTEAVDFSRDKEALTQAVSQWAQEKKFSGYSFEDLTTPTKAVIDLAAEGNLSINGTLTRGADGQPVGFWLWENVDGTAMSLARVAIRRPGVAELGILRTCEQVHAAGITEFCLGGSESKSLDEFKRKMQPIRSIALQTMSLRSTPRILVPEFRKRQPRGSMTRHTHPVAFE